MRILNNEDKQNNRLNIDYTIISAKHLDTNKTLYIIGIQK